MILLSAGIGLTPVLAMLHALAASGSRRDVWWIHGARNSAEHAFAAEARALLKSLPGGHSHIRYSAPGAGDRLAVDFDGPGRLDVQVLKELGGATRGGFLSVRTGRVYERPHRRSDELGCPGRAAA